MRLSSKKIYRWAKEPRQQLINFIKHQVNEAVVSQLPQLMLSKEDIKDPINFADTIPPHKFLHKPVEFYKTELGNYYLPTDAPDDVIAYHMRTGKIFEPEIIEIAKEYITPGSTVLDVGANLGQMSLLFSRMTGPSGQVFAFEADDFIFHLLQKNIQANQCENIRAFFGAVFDKSLDEVYYPEQTFTRFSSYGSYGINLNVEGGRKLQTLVIDDLDIRSPISFMKVDIQGSDLFALKGAIKTIERHQMPIIFEYEEQFQDEFHTCFQDYLDFIQSISYKVVKTVNKINYVIAPAKHKIFQVTEDVTEVKTLDNSLQLSDASFRNNLCKFLKNKNEIEECTHFLNKNGFVSHNLACKDWDIAHIVSEVGDGNFLDMGSSDSYILKNISLKRIKGEKYGIDFQNPDVPINDVKYIVGDLTNTGLPNQHFKNITCLSVLEHEVDFNKFAAEVSRLLELNGRLYVTFDYWDPKVISPIKLYDLVWQPLDQEKLLEFINVCKNYGLRLIQDFDSTLGEPVIHWGYYGPHPTIAYTFGMAVFEKIE